MIPHYIAVLPMYDFPPLRDAHDALWSAIARRLTAAGLDGVPQNLTRSIDYAASWVHPGLLLGQACEYPLATALRGGVRLVAAPHYAAPGCERNRYRSAVIVRATDAARTLEDLRGRRCAINQPDSNSGMNLLRAVIAPHARSGRFFSAVAASGSHLASATLVAEGRADVAAIDCVSLAHFGNLYPQLTARLRTLAWTPASPSLPWITAASTGDGTLAILRNALLDVASDAALGEIRERLLLSGFSTNPDGSFREVLALERSAADAGYREVR